MTNELGFCDSYLGHVPHAKDKTFCINWRSLPITAEKEREVADRIGNAVKRKATPLFSGCMNYFPDALLAVAELSRIGNDQHNPGKALHWDRSKSGDELDALARHLVDAGTLDTDGVRHSAKVAWRALANLQKEIERDRTGAVAGGTQAAPCEHPRRARSNDYCTICGETLRD